MKTYIYKLFFIHLLLSPMLGIAQIDMSNNSQNLFKEQENRQGKLIFSLGVEYRLGLHYENSVSSEWTGRGVDEEDLNRGSAFSYSLDYFIFDKLSVGFHHSFRYDHIAIASTDGLQGGRESFAVVSDRYGLLMDYQAYLTYHFQLFNTHSFFVQVGISQLNNSPVIRKNPVLVVGQSGSFNDDTTLDSRDVVNRIAIGYQKNRFSILSGIYFSDDNPFYSNTTYIAPYLGFKYQLGNLLKK